MGNMPEMRVMNEERISGDALSSYPLIIATSAETAIIMATIISATPTYLIMILLLI